jgi:hypothetical protein
MTLAKYSRLPTVLAFALFLQAAQSPADESLSYGTILYDPPEAADIVRPRIVPVALDAVLAEQRLEIIGARRVLDRGFVVGPPFEKTVAADTVFRRYRVAEGERWCETGIPGVMYTPPHDENGKIFPALCLIDRDGDGGFEAVRMLPYERGIAPRDMPIEPVRLRPAPPVTDSRISRLHVYRRLRIAEIGERDVVVVVEHAQARPGREEPDYDADRPSERITLALRPGASASVAGIGLRIEGGPGGWRLAASGALAPWAVLERGGSAIRIGPFYLAERED